MKIKWGLKIFNQTNCDTNEKLEAAILNTEPVYFRTVKECFEYLEFKLPRVGYGYCDTKYVGKQTWIEYLLEPYRA